MVSPDSRATDAAVSKFMNRLGGESENRNGGFRPTQSPSLQLFTPSNTQKHREASQSRSAFTRGPITAHNYPSSSSKAFPVVESALQLVATAMQEDKERQHEAAMQSGYRAPNVQTSSLSSSYYNGWQREGDSLPSPPLSSTLSNGDMYNRPASPPHRQPAPAPPPAVVRATSAIAASVASLDGILLALQRPSLADMTAFPHARMGVHAPLPPARYTSTSAPPTTPSVSRGIGLYEGMLQHEGIYGKPPTNGAAANPPYVHAGGGISVVHSGTGNGNARPSTALTSSSLSFDTAPAFTSTLLPAGTGAVSSTILEQAPSRLSFAMLRHSMASMTESVAALKHGM
jgi:hypothetical protein